MRDMVSEESLIQARVLSDEDFREGLDWQQVGRLPEAIRCYQRSLTHEESAVVWTFMGWALAESGDHHAAIAACKKAIKLDPEFGHAWNDLGAYFMETGRVDEALFALKRALKSKYFDAPHLAYMNLARYYLHQGKLRRALDAAKSAQDLSPGYRPAIKLAEWIRERMEEWNIWN